MQQLQLPPYNARIIEDTGKKKIFDVIRKKYVSLTPEEWVRQHFIHYMLSLKYPAALMSVEKLVVVNGLRQRADIVLYNRQGQPSMIVECKAPDINLDNGTITQTARYNISLGVKYLVITNGIKSYCIQLGNTTGKYEVLSQLPDYASLNDVQD